MSEVEWRLSRRSLYFDSEVIGPRTRSVMGILNVTPDSFSDGGSYLDPAIAVKHAHEMIADGAQIIDVGGESSRPGADPVSVEEELRRVIPVIKALRARSDVLISVDTVKSRVAAAALDAGADIVNDISACRFDPEMVSVVRDAQAGLVHRSRYRIWKDCGTKLFPLPVSAYYGGVGATDSLWDLSEVLPRRSCEPACIRARCSEFDQRHLGAPTRRIYSPCAQCATDGRCIMCLEPIVAWR